MSDMDCLWCGTEFEPQGTGRSVKKFCSKSCRRDFHTACRIWGEEQYGAGEVTIFQLRICLGRRARRAQHDPASEQGKALETGVRAGGLLGGAAPMAGSAQ